MMLLRCLLRAGALLLALLVATPAAAAGVEVRSPNGRAAVTITLGPDRVPRWAVAWDGRAVLDPAPLRLRFADAPAPAWRLGAVARRAHDAVVTGLLGKASRARDRYREAVIDVAGGARPVQLVVRAYDDGVALRWRFRTAGTFDLNGEDVGFGVTPASRVWAMPVNGFQSSYEEYYRAGDLAAAAPAGALLALPLLVQRDGAWAGITEAALHDWAGLYLTRDAAAAGLGSRLSPRLDRPGVAVTGGAGEHVSPWRVVLLGDAPGRLIESNLVTLLNPPPDRRDWSWVRPGKTSFPWWHDYYWPGQPFTPGLNTATMNAYVDFDARHGIAYHTLDGYRDEAWYGGPITPDGTAQDLTRAGPGIDLPALLAHARARGVRLRLWCHWLPLRAQIDAAFAQWERWGVAGVMVDFMDRDDQAMVAFYDEIARKAADHHLTVVYHGAYKPTGEGRTWPNVLSREAVRGTEYDKFDDNPGSTATHEATTPFVRMLAGPMDIHEGGFDAVAPAAFRNRNTAPQVIGTRARALATYVVEENGAPMVADTPANYEHATGFAFVAATPVTWDETRVLAGEVGRYIVIARRKGKAWWLGAITDEQARTVTVRLPMLRREQWTLDGYADGAGRAARAVHGQVDAATPLVIAMTTAGGYAAKLTRR